MQLEDAFALVVEELTTAIDHHHRFNSAHEGYAVILEEMDELWEEVKANPKKHPEAIIRRRQEAIQVAAMAIRFLIDLCQTDEDIEREEEELRRAD